MYVCKRISSLRLRHSAAPGTSVCRKPVNRRRSFHQVRTAILLAICCSGSLLVAQQGTAGTQLPDPPGAAGPASGAASTAPANTAAISGTVLDPNGSEIQNARVTLTNPSGTIHRGLQSGSNGEFTFAGLPAGQFQVEVSGKGWGTYVSPEIQLHAGDFKFVSGVVLPPATTASVTVSASPATLSEEQVQIAVKQRVLGVFPNFYSTYDWNAPPMLAKQKFQLAFRSATDPVEIAGVAAIAGFEQYNNNFSSFGTGVSGYAKRFGAAYAGSVTSKMLANALLPSVFRQDPRYFYKGTGSTRSRVLYAFAAAFIARGDNGRWEPNYSHIIGSFASGALSNVYYPSSNRGLTLTLANGAVNIGDSIGTNLLREFVLKRFTSRK